MTAAMERVLEAEALPPGRSTRREARLRPEYAVRYPGITAGQWESAATVADRVLAGALLQRQAATFRTRVLLEAHFEFRGGVARFTGDSSGRPRREDR